MACHHYSDRMGRWEPGTRERLERAAVELFVDQGFAETTVPQITARAGLTTRTFFRHFADKREVLFADEDELPARVAAFLAEAPPAWGTLAVVRHGLETLMTPLFASRRDHLRRRNAVIEADDGLRERDLRKLAGLAEVIEEGLRRRGEDELRAALAGALAVQAFRITVGRWLQRDDADLASLLKETFAACHALVEPEPRPGAPAASEEV